MDKTLNDAVKGLRQEFHRTRTTRDVMVSADDLGIVLDYLSAARAPSDAALVEALEGAIDLIVDMSRQRWCEMECTEDELVGDFRAALAAAKGQP